MLKYKSLLKGRILKSKNIKSFLLKDEKKDNSPLPKNSPKRDNIKRFKQFSPTIKNISISKKSTKKLNYDNFNSIDINNESSICEDYEDLFLNFLMETEGIDYFENQLEMKKEKKIRINKAYIYNYIYQTFTEEPKRWNQFLFSEAVYIVLYIKSRSTVKEIIQFSSVSGIKIKDIINSYDKKYTCKKKVKNWSLRPQDAYKNLENIKLKAKLEKEKMNNNGNPYFKHMNYTDFVVKTDNNGRGKTLLFLGKGINIYIDDLDKYHSKDNGISMAVEESEFNKNTKNEIIYTFDDIILKTKKRNMSINSNRYELNKLKNDNIKNIIEKKYLKTFKTNLNLDYKNSTKYLSLDKKEKGKNKTKIYNKKPNINNIFNNYKKNLNKLPYITKLEKPKSNSKKIIKEIKVENKHNSNKNEKMNYKRVLSGFKNKKQQKKYINSFWIFEREYLPKTHKKIINYFTKENSDFYY